ncbi:hypothetical protein AB1Y20_023008 [Prymnesium parvum]|uniref:Uncharacterized protein n=1 Tax=Prymnesium parvum TaxID=97485 RepID=A0AB34JF57_PRYPA
MATHAEGDEHQAEQQPEDSSADSSSVQSVYDADYNTPERAGDQVGEDKGAAGWGSLGGSPPNGGALASLHAARARLKATPPSADVDRIARLEREQAACVQSISGIIDRSVSGIVHKFAGAAVAVQSVRQHSIAIDAHSSECFTASTAACQAVAYRGILTELRISQEVPTPVYSDSRSTLMVAQNSAALRKSIFILRRILYMREAVDAGEVDFYSCAGGTNPADPLTKYVTKRVFLGARRFWMGGALAEAGAAGAATSASARPVGAEHASGQQTGLTKSELPPPSRAEIPRPNKDLMTCSSGLLG